VKLNKNKIAVLGGGHGAHTMAADFTARGFKVNMYEMPEFKHNIQQLFKTKTIEIKGGLRGRYTLEKVTSDIEEAVKDVRYIAIVTPAFAHKSYANLLKGKLSKEQIIILYPGAFGGLLFKEIFGEDECPIIAETNTLPYDTRLTGPCQVMIYGFNDTNIGFIPGERGSEIFEELRKVHPFVKRYNDLLEAGLSNVNPTLHSGLCLFSINDIENWPKRPFFLYEHGVTPSSVKMDMALENERKKIGRKFGYNLTVLEDMLGLKEGYTWQELYRNVHGNISLTPITGPHDIFNRYLTEDVPYGLVPWSYIGKEIGVETKYMDAVVNIYNIIHGRDWWKEGRNMSDIGLKGMDIHQIKNYLKTGKKII
jgi:opine dehydrogenase